MAKITTEQAVQKLREELRSDDGYRQTWKATLAVCYQDATASAFMHAGIHEISNAAADRFLELLCNDTEISPTIVSRHR